MAANTTVMPSRRERVRAATKDEIKDAALDLMRKRGTADLKFTDIARELGMTAPALYRYYKDRNDLLSALIYDAYYELADQLHAAGDHIDDPRAALSALMHAYRRFAVSDPTRFALIFGQPIPDYDLPEDCDTKESASRAMSALERVTSLAAKSGATALLPADGPTLIEVIVMGKTIDDDTSAEALQAIFLVWSTLHGYCCLEAFNHLDWLPPEALEEFFQAQVELCARILGL